MATPEQRARKRFAPLGPNRGNQKGLSQLKGIIFDVDGTLCKPQSYMFKQMRCPSPIKSPLLKSQISNHPPSDCREALGIPKSTDILDHIHSLPQPAQDEAQTAVRAIERAAMVEQEPQPGLNELITSTFAPIVTRDFRPPKPDPAGILHIAEAWGLDDGAESLVMVGDSVDDMVAGYKAGAATVLLSSRDNEGLEEHEYTGVAVQRLDELVGMLEEGFEERRR
ncbi:MAG: hypothetical protein LQ338_000355 [Usnochroma carphineum]|nr:MAG: hypothetical protein LQ338_000355 [Usnochroma carphineum]